MLFFKMHQNHHLILHLLCWSVSSDINTSRQLITWEPLQQDKDSFNTGVSQVSTVSTARRGALGSSCVYLNDSHIHRDHSFCCFQDKRDGFGQGRRAEEAAGGDSERKREGGEVAEGGEREDGEGGEGQAGQGRLRISRRREANTPDLISHLVMMFCASTKTFK